MSTHKHFDKICCVILALTLMLTVLFMNAEKLGVTQTETTLGYETTLFDTSIVHTIDIVIDDWEGFIENCTDEEYVICDVVIDGEAMQNVVIRAKGNTSLTQVASYGNGRYSFKIEFDHYDETKTYKGLDKLCLNNIIQDNTYMKDYLTYTLMNEFGVASPLTSYAKVSVNGEEWGLYLAVEAVEESFLQRNYGSNYGDLYKPDSQSMGGGRGNGQDFNFTEFEEMRETLQETTSENQTQSFTKGNMGNMNMSMGSSDVSLIYSDDNPESYPNIFDNAKTTVTSEDQTRLIKALKCINENVDLEQYLYIDQVIRYFVVHNFVLNFDSYTGSMIHNYYLYEEDGKLSMIPWDYNLAFGGFQSSGSATTLANYPIDEPVSGGTIDSRPMLAWIFNNESYLDLYHQYFSEFIETYYTQGKMSQIIEETATLIDSYVQSDPTKFCTYEEYQIGVETLQEFCELRLESIEKQLEGTIGSTSATQDQTTLVDASQLTISDMGSMNQTMGGGMDLPTTGDMELPTQDQTQIPTDGTIPSQGDMQMPSDGTIPSQGDMQMPSDGTIPSQGDMQMPTDGTIPSQGDMQMPTDGTIPSQGDMQMPTDGTIPSQGDMQMPGGNMNGMPSTDTNPFIKVDKMIFPQQKDKCQIIQQMVL